MNVLVVLTGPAYGTENVYNGLRLCLALKKTQSDVRLRVFLLGDAVGTALAKQETPKGFYNLEHMLGLLLKQDVRIKTCGTCLKARGVDESNLIDSIDSSTMEELAEWTSWADKVLTL